MTQPLPKTLAQLERRQAAVLRAYHRQQARWSIYLSLVLAGAALVSLLVGGR